MTKRKQTTRSSSSAGSRARTRARRQERRQQQRQQRLLFLGGAVAVIAVLVAVVVILSNQPADAPIPDGTLERYDGIPRTVSEEGFPVLGDLNAPVRVEEYSSFSCTACAQFHAASMDTLVDLVRDGVISYTFIPSDSIGSVPNAGGSARAALCAREQGYFFEYHDALFQWQRDYGNRAFPQNRLASGFDNLGLSQNQYESCRDSSRIGDLLDDATAAYRDNDVTATPTTFVQGFEVASDVDAIIAAVNDALAASGANPVSVEGEGEPEITAEPTEVIETEVTETVESTEAVTVEPTEAAETTPES